MYKLVIVEDEWVSRSRISDLINQAQRPFQLVAAYDNGIDAYDGIMSDCPDVIVTDLRIPYMDGIELSKKVREIFPLVKIIIITGYDEFDFAKEAANIGVVGFITKPVTLHAMQALLEKAEQCLNNEFLTASNLNQLSAFYERNLPIIRESGLNRLSRMTAVAPVFENKLRSLHIRLDYRYFVMCVFDFDEAADEAAHYDIAFSSIREIIVENFDKTDDYELFNRHEKLCLLLKSNAPPDFKALERRLYCVIQRAGRYSGMPVSAGVSSAYENNRNFALMVKEAMYALGHRSVMGGQKVFTQNSADTVQTTRLYANEGLIKELGYLMRLQNADACLDRIDAIRQLLDKSEDSIYYVATSIFNTLVKTCEDLSGLCARHGSIDNLYRVLFALKTDDEIFDYLKQTLRNVRALNDNIIVDNMDRNLHRIMQYMEKHFTDPNITFESMAKDLNFSMSYISALLKKKLNTSYVKMLTGLRIEKAKQLLADPALKIINVAEQLGYKDSYYFSHCFKKYVGVSPKRFRENA